MSRRERFGVRHVADTGEFLVWDNTRKFARGQALVCRDEDAVTKLVRGILQDEGVK